MIMNIVRNVIYESLWDNLGMSDIISNHALSYLSKYHYLPTGYEKPFPFCKIITHRLQFSLCFSHYPGNLFPLLIELCNCELSCNQIILFLRDF